MNYHRRARILVTTLLVFTSSIFGLSSTAEAQYGGRGSSYRSKINKLDDTVVLRLPIPILFGVTLRMITSNFGDPRDGGARTHEGLDIMAPKGAPIVSPTEAVVIRTGNGSGSGNYVTTANPGGETFVYMHLSEILVKNGDELNEGDIIGLVGNTGNASGGPAHLHFEVRGDGRRATDPFPRVTREFSLADKIEFLEDAISAVDNDDEDDFVEFVVGNYRVELALAKASGIKLPDVVEEAMQTITIVVTSNVPSATPSGDLTLGSRGTLVITLQEFLIAKDTGPAGRALSEAGATGYFGSITERALAEYQQAHGISPAIGYYGPKTRAYILANE